MASDDEVPDRDVDEETGRSALTDPDGPDEPEKPDEPKAATNGNVREFPRSGRSVADRAADGTLDDVGEPPIGEEDDGQLFVWEQGRKVTLAQLLSRGTPVEHAFVFGGKRLKGAGQFMPWDDDVLLVARGKPGKVSLIPTRDDEEKVTKVTVETHIPLRVVNHADTEHAMDMLSGVLESRGYRRLEAADVEAGQG